jgi:hypothetical protein
MRGDPGATSVEVPGLVPDLARCCVVLIAPGWVRIFRAVPPARWGGVAGLGALPRPADPERLQAPLRCSGWAEAAEGLPPGLYYLH